VHDETGRFVDGADVVVLVQDDEGKRAHRRTLARGRDVAKGFGFLARALTRQLLVGKRLSSDWAHA
jgi:hypothetical protein